MIMWRSYVRVIGLSEGSCDLFPSCVVRGRSNFNNIILTCTNYLACHELGLQLKTTLSSQGNPSTFRTPRWSDGLKRRKYFMIS